jgi:ubiquinone/menaquinone biosynthesis C-methylase UbiE
MTQDLDLSVSGFRTGEWSMAGNYSPSEWLQLHNRAAASYINSEWSREMLLGVAARRRSLFALARGRVLDVGCGYGINFPYLTNATEVIGVDFSPVMLAKGRQRIRGRGITAPVQLRQGEAEALDFPDNSFHTVISSLSTCSFFDPLAALQEMRRVCKPNGQILLIEHGRSSWAWLGRYQDRHAQEQLEQGGCRWNQEPQELVKQAGLKILDAQRYLFGVFYAMRADPAKR